jgi:predicted nucleic acid-binding protein
MPLILFDTNIFVGLHNGFEQATAEMAPYDQPAVSVIRYMELRSGERA